LASLNIPKDHLEPLETLISLSDHEMEALLGSLSDIPLSVDLDACIKPLAPKLKSSSIKHPEKIIQVLISLSVTRAHSDPPVRDFVDAVLHAIEESSPKAFSNGQQTRARDNLTKLLSFEPLSIAAKAHHLLADQERLLAGVRILTDARPVYGQEIQGDPVAVLINHTLKLSYYQDGKPLDFFVALDTADIANLKLALDRAEAKADSLKQMFTKADIRIVQS
jgi:hypothetical protein